MRLTLLNTVALLSVLFIIIRLAYNFSIISHDYFYTKLRPSLIIVNCYGFSLLGQKVIEGIVNQIIDSKKSLILDQEKITETLLTAHKGVKEVRYSYTFFPLRYEISCYAQSPLCLIDKKELLFEESLEICPQELLEYSADLISVFMPSLNQSKDKQQIHKEFRLLELFLKGLLSEERGRFFIVWYTPIKIHLVSKDYLYHFITIAPELNHYEKNYSPKNKVKSIIDLYGFFKKEQENKRGFFSEKGNAGKGWGRSIEIDMRFADGLIVRYQEEGNVI